MSQWLNFTGNDYEEAVEKALKHFNVQRERLQIETVRIPGDDEKPKGFFKLFAKKDQYEIKVSLLPPKTVVKHEEKTEQPAVTSANEVEEIEYHSDAESYFIAYKEDGVYLTITEETPVSELINFISRKHIKEVDFSTLKSNTSEMWREFLIAPPQEEVLVDEDCEIIVSPDKMSASVRFFKPYGGKRLTKEDVLAKLDYELVEYGIDHIFLDKLMQRHNYNHLYTVAKGTNPEPGADGYVVMDVEFSRRNTLDEAQEHLAVDFKSVMNYVKVKEGDMLAHAIPPTDGKEGRNVENDPKPAIPGKPAKIPVGKHVRLSVEGTEAFAETSGIVVEEKGKITVENVLTINNAIDITTGNIDYEGSVIIFGDITSGFSVTATKNIDIKGHVEAATIRSGGNITIVGGVLGGDKAVLEARGDIVVDYLQYARVIAGGNILSGALIGCEITSGGSISVLAGKGIILGGNVEAATSITARVIGSKVSANSRLVVNSAVRRKELYSAKTDRISDLTSQVKQYQSTIQKLQTIIQGGRKDENIRKMLNEELRKESEANAELEQLYKDIALLESPQALYGGKLNVESIIHAPTHVTICACELNVITDYQHTTFKIGDDKQIHGFPYEG